MIPKKRVEDIDPSSLVEPAMDEQAWGEFLRGVRLFNEMKYWEAHECWEEVWKQRPEESRIFFQGIIQAAAAYHLIIERPRYTGAVNNSRKALQKLALFPHRFLRLDIAALRSSLERTLEFLESLGPSGVARFPTEHLPVLEVKETS